MPNGTESQSCALLGDSFVERLRRHVGSGWYVAGRRVELWGYPGKTEAFLQAKVNTMPQNLFEFNYVALSVGSNDVCDARLSPECIVESLMDLSRTLLAKFGVTRVIVCSILHRSTWSHHMRGLTLSEYNAWVDMVNRILQRRLRKNGHITFWKHQSCIGPKHPSHDGVHLNEKGLQLYRQSLYTVPSHATSTEVTDTTRSTAQNCPFQSNLSNK
jgi:hypothetical protein